MKIRDVRKDQEEFNIIMLNQMGSFQKKIVPFSRVLTLRPPTPPPGLVEFWDFEFLCFNLNVGVGTMSTETDFTLKKC